MIDFKKEHNERKAKFFKELSRELKTKAFSEKLLTSTEESCGFDKNYNKILFSSGLPQILQEFESWQDDLMIEELKKTTRPKKVRDQIALALEIRIMKLIDKKASLNTNAAFLLPSNILSGSESFCHSCDLIWKYAGDKSTDFNYYTKRGLLLPVYLSARTFYFADNSAEYKKTKEFIKNSLDNIINIASLKNQIKLPKIEDIPILRLFS